MVHFELELITRSVLAGANATIQCTGEKKSHQQTRPRNISKIWSLANIRRLALMNALYLKSLSFSLRGVLCCIAVGYMPLLHCAWLVVRADVLCCIIVGTAALAFLVRVRALCVS
jgi:hypothetical protein